MNLEIFIETKPKPDIEKAGEGGTCELCGKVFPLNYSYTEFHTLTFEKSSAKPENVILSCGGKCYLQVLKENQVTSKYNLRNTIAPVSDNNSCKHLWVCLRDRIHGTTKRGNYMAYKCTECNAFQRRPV